MMKLLSLLLALTATLISEPTRTSCNETTSTTTTTTRKKLQIGVKRRVDNCALRSKRGDTLHVSYVGTLEDGTEFDNSSNYDDSFLITLGYGQVIRGWEQGLLGMCVGEKRKLVIPPELAYGTFGALPKIPPNATVIFTVELVKLVPKEEPRHSHIHEEL